MGILTKKIFRDLKANKGRSISIVLILAVSTGLYGGLLLMHINTINTFDKLEEDTALEDVRYSLNEFVNIENLTLDGIDNIKAWDSRISLLTSLRLEEGSKEIFTAPIYGVADDKLPSVNNFLLQSGDYFDTNKNNEILVITQFVSNNDLKIGDQIFLDTPFGSKELKLKGEILSPEYIYNINPISGLPDLIGLASSWLAIDEMRTNFGLPDNVVNEILVRFDSNISDDLKKQLINEIKDEIVKIAPFVSYTLVEDEGEQTMKDADIGSLDEFARVFGIIILMLALFVMYDNVSKLIASQRNYIGTMRALGGHKSVVTSHYTKMSMVLASIGVTLGVPFGIKIGEEMVVKYASILGIPAPVTDFYAEPFIESIAINLFLAFLVSFISSIAASKIDPREAMASSFVTMVFNAKPIIEKITSKIPGLNTPSMTIPIRTVFRQRRRTILTVFTYAISMLLVISSIGFMDSFNYAIDDNYANIQTYDMEAHFITPILPDDIATVLDNVDGIQKIEFFSTTMTEIDNFNKSVMIEAFPENTTLRKFNIVEGVSTGLGDDGLVMGSILADELNMTVGDDLTFFNNTFEIRGITSELLAEKIFLRLDTLQDILHHDNNVTSVYIKANDNIDFDGLKDIKNDIIDTSLPVAIIIVNEEVKDSINFMIQGLMALIAIMILIGFGTVLLLSFNTIVLEIMSREMEFINLRTLGAGRWKVFRVIAIQALLISFMGSILAIPVSYNVSIWIMKELVGDLMIIPVYIKPESYLTGIMSAVLASSVGVYAAYRRIMSIDLANAMRIRMAN